MAAFHGSRHAFAERNSVDPREVDKFSRVADDWWDADSDTGVGALHYLNPTRVSYVSRHVRLNFGMLGSGGRGSGSGGSSGGDVAEGSRSGARQELSGVRILDVGCGGGIFAEALAELGADVTGVDPSRENIAAARAHAEREAGAAGREEAGGGEEQLRLRYEVGTVEAKAREQREGAQQYDVVCSMEVLEHLPREALQGFVADCASLVRPGGLLVFSTLNRTAKSFAEAIVGAEFVLSLVPPGTHDWAHFITPSELKVMVEAASGGMHCVDFCGLRPDLDPVAMAARVVPVASSGDPKKAALAAVGRWKEDAMDLDVNYICVARKEEGRAGGGDGEGIENRK